MLDLWNVLEIGGRKAFAEELFDVRDERAARRRGAFLVDRRFLLLRRGLFAVNTLGVTSAYRFGACGNVGIEVLGRKIRLTTGIVIVLAVLGAVVELAGLEYRFRGLGALASVANAI